MKRCFIILGTGNSGTRFITRLFVANGCFGSDGFDQSLDDGIFPNEAKDIVWKTHCAKPNSFYKIGSKDPLRYGNIAIKDIIEECKKHNYIPTLIGVYRDLSLMSYGAFEKGYRVGKDNYSDVGSEEVHYEEVKLQENYISFYSDMFDLLNFYKNEYKCFVLNYSCLVNNPVLYTRLISSEIGYNLKAIQTINGNAKHYKRYNR